MAAKRPIAPHYQRGAIEPIDYIRSHQMCFCAGNVIKYVTRYRWKGTPVADLEKARDYINFLIEAEHMKELKAKPARPWWRRLIGV